MKKGKLRNVWKVTFHHSTKPTPGDWYTYYIANTIEDVINHIHNQADKDGKNNADVEVMRISNAQCFIAIDTEQEGDPYNPIKIIYKKEN